MVVEIGVLLVIAFMVKDKYIKSKYSGHCDICKQYYTILYFNTGRKYKNEYVCENCLKKKGCNVTKP